jgi:hypothetical protein
VAEPDRSRLWDHLQTCDASRQLHQHGRFEVEVAGVIEYFNRTFAKPFNWTYTGKPTPSANPQRPRTWREKAQPRKLEQILALVA